MDASQRDRADSAPTGHRTAELRSIALHRLVAERLDDELLRKARERVAGWLAVDGPYHVQRR
jgi:hypothetical protein